MLAGVLHRLDVLMWSMADPKRRGPEPRPMRTPVDDARVESMRRRSDPDEIARKLGIPPERR